MHTQSDFPAFQKSEIRKEEKATTHLDTDSQDSPTASTGVVFRSNVNATRKRHMRVFGTSSYFGVVYIKTKKIMKNLAHFLYNKIKRTSRRFIVSSDHVIVRDPFKTFVRQTIAIACSLFVITSLPPTRILETGFTADYFDDTDFIDENAQEELQLPSFLINEEGFVLKTSPVTEDVSRIGYNDMLKHTVVPGDTLSGVAHLYGLSLKTILWENKLNPDSTLKIGQALIIPAVDGVTHTVAEKGDTLETIAKKYEVKTELIKEHNNIEGDTIAAGQKLFIPGGELQDLPVIVRTGITGSGRGSVGGGRTIASTQVYTGQLPSSAKCDKLTFPTVGKITQGYRIGHYADDIANSQKGQKVWAACSGTVVKVGLGCPGRDAPRRDLNCHGGYGNNVSINHGPNMETLYAHLGDISVKPGQFVQAGEVLGTMSNTGRAYGVTGIHLHFELYVNRQKKNPMSYM